MKFAVKVHNKYLSEAVQKLARDNGYSTNGIPLNPKDSVLYFTLDKQYTWFSDYYLKDNHSDTFIFDALTDWQKIEEAMKPKEPRVIWVNENSDGRLSDTWWNSADEAKSYRMDCKQIKFQEVI